MVIEQWVHFWFCFGTSIRRDSVVRNYFYNKVSVDRDLLIIFRDIQNLTTTVYNFLILFCFLGKYSRLGR